VLGGDLQRGDEEHRRLVLGEVRLSGRVRRKGEHGMSAKHLALLALATLAMSGPAWAVPKPVPVLTCAGVKNKAVGVYVNCRSNADAKFIRDRGVDAERRDRDLAKCFAKFEAKWEDIPCSSGPVGLPAIAALLDDCSLQSTVGILGTGTAGLGDVAPRTVITLPPDTLLKCGEKRTKAAGNYFKCRMQAEAAFIRSTQSYVDRAAALRDRLTKCSAKLAGAWAKAGPDGNCPVGVDLPELVLDLTACSDEAVDGTTPRDDGCYEDTGPTVIDGCTKLEWEKKGGFDSYAYGAGIADPANLHDMDNKYVWAGNCGNAFGALCQPNADAAGTCTAQTGGATGCSECGLGEGICQISSLAITTVWDWVNQVNASNFGGHSDWRMPTSAGKADFHCNGTGQRAELESLFSEAQGECVVGQSGPCVVPPFEPTALGRYWTASPWCYTDTTAYDVLFFDVHDVNGNNVFVEAGYNKGTSMFVRAVRRIQ